VALRSTRICRPFHLSTVKIFVALYWHFYLNTSRLYMYVYLGNDRRSDVLDASERKYIRWNCVAHLRTSRLSRASQVRILSVEGCARYDDYRASWTWLIPTTRRRRGRPPRRSFHGLYANFLMYRADAL